MTASVCTRKYVLYATASTTMMMHFALNYGLPTTLL